MTAEEFRSIDTNRLRLQELLNDPVLQQAVIIVKDGAPLQDAIVTADAICSVRILSQKYGWDSAVTLLLNLTQPNPIERDSLPPPDYGTTEPINL